MQNLRLVASGLVLLALSALTGLLFPACGSPTPLEGPIPLHRAHAHNDYEHSRPLYDALDRGFLSVEADVHLVGDQLLVAHDPEDVAKDKTLQAVYLDPLRERVQENNGSVYGDGTQMILLVDLKTEAEATYATLRQVLGAYVNILTVFGLDGRQDGPVLVIISGNRPGATMAQEEVRYAAYDGRITDLTSSAPSALVPLISDKWTDHFSWQGRGDMPESERAKLVDIVKMAHDEGRRVRFWATPDRKGPQRDAVWRALIDADVDLINTDDLEGLQSFLLEHDPSQR